MAITKANLLAKAARGEVMCILYRVEGGKLGVLDEDGLAEDEMRRELCQQGRLRLGGSKGQQPSPFRRVSRWLRA
jgi:hypothetical protein